MAMRTVILLAAFAALGSAFKILARDGTSAAVITSCKKQGDCALTFDDGPYKYHKNVSDTVTAAGGKCTFFLNGNNYACIYKAPYPDYINYSYSAGHQLASHTWSHQDMTDLSQAQLDSEIDQMDTAFQKILGVTPTCLRPPYGNYNQTVLEAIGRRNKTAVIWDVDSGDSTGSTVAQSKKAYDDGIANSDGTMLALNHEVYPNTVTEVLPYAIQRLQDWGFTLVTVAECLGIEPYSSVGEPAKPDFTWHC
ncbi:carbohydrate esterase family 4 protein [Mycena capillaripes]|nr:carbohydrate esterase family 4 protein [Mycena capillaripes]